MKRFLLFSLLLPLIGWCQLTIKVNYAYQLTPLSDTLFLAGNFNTWAPNDPSYQFSRTGLNTFEITISPGAGSLQYKITRGAWASVEGNSNGGPISNRTFNYSGSATTINIQINGWEDIGGDGQQTTASSNVYILDTDFPFPELNTTRRVWIYLPPDYYTSSKQYPVLYMHDGQNLFDYYFSSFGEWQVDESLDSMFYQGDYGIIAIGIDNGGANRLNEYSPWVNPSYGGGQGAQYVNWMVNDLKPYIDTNFRTYTQPKYSGIMGSSMGGLISQYGGVQFPQTFKKVGLLSPSFWFTDTIFNQIHTQGIQTDQKFYFVSGTTESSSMVPLMVEMKDSLISKGLDTSRIKLLTRADGQHSEWFWAREFPAAYKWLFSDLNLNTTSAKNSFAKDDVFKIHPNPNTGFFSLQYLGDKMQNATVTITDALGKEVYQTAIKSWQTEIDLSQQLKGIYFVKVQSDKYSGVKKIVMQ